MTNGPISAVGCFTRGTAFFAVALVVGWQVRARARERARFEAQLRAVATQDRLCGPANRRGWEERADAELQRTAPGHAAVDRLLVAWSGAIREVDLLARLGGDEFSLLLPENELADAAEVVARMRFATRKATTSRPGWPRRTKSESLEEVMERADAALYTAKRARRGVTRAARALTAAGS